MKQPRTALVTGASSGIGLAVSAALSAEGYRVIGTSRHPERLEPGQQLDGVEYLQLDLESAASIESCAAAAGPVDVLINNAGESQVGALEDLPGTAVRRLFELNVFGPVSLTRLLVEGMRERGYGRVVMVGSMLGSFPLAYRSSYGASKSAIKAFADGIRFELSPFGVWVTTVEPGAVSTGISARRTRYVSPDSPHFEGYSTMLSHLDANEAQGIGAERVAGTVLRAVTARRPRPLYAVGSSAPLAFTAQRLLPRSLMERIVARKHGLKR